MCQWHRRRNTGTGSRRRDEAPTASVPRGRPRGELVWLTRTELRSIPGYLWLAASA
jgi:hypothetical protein